jgi:hypothetical protein
VLGEVADVRAELGEFTQRAKLNTIGDRHSHPSQDGAPSRTELACWRTRLEESGWDQWVGGIATRNPERPPNAIKHHHASGPTTRRRRRSQGRRRPVAATTSHNDPTRSALGRSLREPIPSEPASVGRSHTDSRCNYRVAFIPRLVLATNSSSDALRGSGVDSQSPLLFACRVMPVPVHDDVSLEPEGVPDTCARW